MRRSISELGLDRLIRRGRWRYGRSSQANRQRPGRCLPIRAAALGRAVPALHRQLPLLPPRRLRRSRRSPPLASASLVSAAVRVGGEDSNRPASHLVTPNATNTKPTAREMPTTGSPAVHVPALRTMSIGAGTRAIRLVSSTAGSVDLAAAPAAWHNAGHARTASLGARTRVRATAPQTLRPSGRRGSVEAGFVARVASCSTDGWSSARSLPSRRRSGWRRSRRFDHDREVDTDVQRRRSPGL